MQTNFTNGGGEIGQRNSEVTITINQKGFFSIIRYHLDATKYQATNVQLQYKLSAK